MKNLALILITVFGVSAVTFAQTEPAKTKTDTKGQPLKTEKGTANKPVKKVRPVVGKKKDVPAEKMKY